MKVYRIHRVLMGIDDEFEISGVKSLRIESQRVLIINDVLRIIFKRGALLSVIQVK